MPARSGARQGDLTVPLATPRLAAMRIRKAMFDAVQVAGTANISHNTWCRRPSMAISPPGKPQNRSTANEGPETFAVNPGPKIAGLAWARDRRA